LIDELEEKNILNEILEIDLEEPELDMDKLIVAGHSFGGATAIKTGWEDKRVKCVLTMDPWLLPIKKTIEDKSYKGFNKDLKLQIINSEGFIAADYDKNLAGLQTLAKGVVDHESISILHSGH
jgi:platelet-activating factor acetylhydrolase